MKSSSRNVFKANFKTFVAAVGTNPKSFEDFVQQTLGATTRGSGEFRP